MQSLKFQAASLAVSLVVLLLSVAAAGPHGASASHETDNGFLWFSNTYANSGVDDHTTCCNWWTPIQSATSSWYNQTVLWPHTVNHSSARVHVWNGTYDDVGWFGGTYAWSGSTLCGTPTQITGNCNKTSVKADSAVIHLNDLYFGAGWEGNYSEAWQKIRTTTHELGHPYGLNHPPCNTDGSPTHSVMTETTCTFPSQPYTNSVQQPYDSNDVLAAGYE